MSKMTDEQIIKHIYGCENKDCRVIVIFNKLEDTIDEITIGDIADAINRQQAENNRQRAEIEKLQLSRKQKLKEIERLNVELVGMRGACNSYKMHYDNAKTENERLQVRLRKERHQFEDLGKMYSVIRAEAIKEFAKKLKECEYKEEYEDHLCYMVDNLVKEMVGEGK